ncbi:unnamed protein product [Arctia plantaginis]|uniref:Uncharacterized protein n=1 Tax=Arctia plantaginis TaxID=874455 RepID=A0A8S0YPV5_ARCPL|nr:unnamed protein product [Arctia plantaginis]CAB3239163.1 unnamed protein product [Arctia plantaginis]
MMNSQDTGRIKTEDDAKGFRNDPHGLLPTLDELSAARPPGRHRAVTEGVIHIALCEKCLVGACALRRRAGYTDVVPHRESTVEPGDGRYGRYGGVV